MTDLAREKKLATQLGTQIHAGDNYRRVVELIRAGTPILRMMGLVQIFDAVGLTLAGALKGAGATRAVMLTDVTTAWLLFLPSAWFFGIHLELGLSGAWIGVLLWFFVYAVGIAWWYVRGDWWRHAYGSVLEA